MTTPTIPWRCRFGWHAWPQWSKPVRGEHTFFPAFTSIASTVPTNVQTRVCAGCGKHEIREAV